MEYVELNITGVTDDLSEMLVAELAELPFESFVPEQGTLRAYIPRMALADCMPASEAVLARYGVSGRYIALEDENWNAAWEASFSPVRVGDRLCIRAPFHAPSGCELEAIVTPRMAFGSGHHATTVLMAAELLEMPLAGRRGLDLGTGTGVLAIVATLGGALSVDAVDIDEWAVSNALENISENKMTERISVLQGDISAVCSKKYDFIAANINRNILLKYLPALMEMLTPGGDLLLSGFLLEDVAQIPLEGAVRVRDGWALIHGCRPA